MIAHIKGKIIKKTNKGIIINTGNIGYKIHLSEKTLSELKENQDAEFFIHSHIKEDIFDLYGFKNYHNLEFFQQLININGIGPKVALEILNSPPDKIKSAIINEDEIYICKIPGIGKKTAKRLILELKEKIDLQGLENREYKQITKEVHNEAIEALVKLGYQKHEVIKIIKSSPEEITQTEEIITFFLKNV